MTTTPDEVVAEICKSFTDAALLAEKHDVGYFHFIDIFDEFMRESATADRLTQSLPRHKE